MKFPVGFPDTQNPDPAAGEANSVHAVVFFIANWTSRCSHFCVTTNLCHNKKYHAVRVAIESFHRRLNRDHLSAGQRTLVSRGHRPPRLSRDSGQTCSMPAPGRIFSISIRTSHHTRRLKSEIRPG